MRFIGAIGQRWTRTVKASFTIALVAAVATAGFTVFGSEVFAAWKSAGNAEQALAAAGFINFEAPATTVTQIGEDALVAKNWKFTQNTLAENILLSQQYYAYSLLVLSYEQAFLNFLNVIATRNPALAPLTQRLATQAIALYTATLNVVAIRQAQVNASIPPALRPPPTVPASPSS